MDKPGNLYIKPGASSQGKKGGNVDFKADEPTDEGRPLIPDGGDPPEGSIIFSFTNDDGTEREAMRIDNDGNFFVQGKLVENDQQVYDGFVEWLSIARVKSGLDKLDS